MRTDIRVAQTVGSDVARIESVVYDEHGEIDSVINLSEHASLGDAYKFIDMMYKASLKPVLVKHTDGSYE